MHDFRARFDGLCQFFRSTGEGEIFFGAADDLLAAHPEGVHYVIELFDQEARESFKESLAMVIIDHHPCAPAIEFLQVVCQWPAEDFLDYAGYRQWARDRASRH